LFFIFYHLNKIIFYKSVNLVNKKKLFPSLYTTFTRWFWVTWKDLGELVFSNLFLSFWSYWKIHLRELTHTRLFDGNEKNRLEKSNYQDLDPKFCKPKLKQEPNPIGKQRSEWDPNSNRFVWETQRVFADGSVVQVVITTTQRRSKSCTFLFRRLRLHSQRLYSPLGWTSIWSS